MSKSPGEGSYYAVFDVVEDGKIMLGISAELHVCQDGSIMCRIWPKTEEDEGIYEYRQVGSIYKLKTFLKFDRLVPTFKLFPKKNQDYVEIDSKDIDACSWYKGTGYVMEHCGNNALDKKLKIAGDYFASIRCNEFSDEKAVYNFLKEHSKKLGYRRLVEIACYLWMKCCNNIKRNVLLPSLSQLEDNMSKDRIFYEDFLLELLTLEEIKKFMLDGGSKFKWRITQDDDEYVVFKEITESLIVKDIIWKKDDAAPNVAQRKIFIKKLCVFEDVYVEHPDHTFAAIIISILDFVKSGQPQQGNMF